MIDFKELRAVAAEVEALERDGKLTREEYERLKREAEAIVGSETRLLEGILMTGLEHGFVSAG